MLIHTSNEKLDIKKLNKVRQIITFKPIGLWYATNKEWINFSKNWASYKYMYMIKLKYTTLDKPNSNSVLKITNKNDVIEFTLKYGIIEKGYFDKMEYKNINWQNVEKDFGGVDVTELFLREAHFIQEYNTYEYKIKLSDYDITWLNTWDVPSGCVWNPKAIKQFKLI